MNSQTSTTKSSIMSESTGEVEANDNRPHSNNSKEENIPEIIERGINIS